MGRQIIWLSVPLMVLAFGCSHRAPQRPSAPAPAPKASVPLPEWAPKDPSPEFLRAAKVLKPMPPELFRDAAQTPLRRRSWVV